MTTAKSKSKKVRSMQPPQKRAASRRQGRTDPDRPWLRRAAEGVGRQVYRCQAGPGGPWWPKGADKVEFKTQKRTRRKQPALPKICR